MPKSQRPIGATPEQEFALLVKERREASGWSQEELARRVSEATGATFHQTAITRIEGGTRNIRLNEVVAIAQALGLDVSAVLGNRKALTDRATGVAAMLAILHQRREEHRERLARADAEMAMAALRRDEIVTSLAGIQRSIDDLADEYADLRGYTTREEIDGLH